MHSFLLFKAFFCISLSVVNCSPICMHDIDDFTKIFKYKNNLIVQLYYIR